MSQNSNHCDAVLDALCQFVDGELSPEITNAITQHLGVCAPCKAHADLERTVKESVQRCCQPEPAPEQLRQRVIESIASTRVEWVAGVVVTQTFTFEIREQ